LIASTLPGPGSIYIGQNLRFLHPVYHGETVKCVVTITDIDSKKKQRHALYCMHKSR
jgi:3-hydroxybutyryl-CoA dehydratase